MKRKRIIAIAWFTPDDYEAIRAISIDEVHATFEEWERATGPKLAQLEGLGLFCRKIIVRPDELQAWARQEGVPIDSASRAMFAVIKLSAQHDPDMN